ncbi:hypothetical protein BK730_05115 [Bacillus wiedmannii]|uniref:Uncharacterized protein n=1 Tax=Bacillus wiedmannii TaxID=1890302 RepID=A0A242ZLI0_9BACI|nr:hypothetical protein BK730_05115 [Bacillus wiedmannii]
MYDMNHNFARLAGLWFFLFCGYKMLKLMGEGSTPETENEEIVIDDKQVDTIATFNDYIICI